MLSSATMKTRPGNEGEAQGARAGGAVEVEGKGGGACRRFKRAPGVVARRVAGEMLLVPARRKVSELAAIFALNKTGEVVWELLDSPATAEAIGRELAKRFTVELEAAAGDCARILGDLERERLVIAVP